METAYQSLLFNDCSSTCEAYSICGGYKPTAPCGCAWSVESGLRYRCSKCYIFCRERGSIEDINLKSRNFAEALTDGATLDQVRISQPDIALPQYIPTLTAKCKEEAFTKFVAVDIRSLLNCRKQSAAALKKYFDSENMMRKYLNVSKDCKLMAVLNGQDWMLESFWNSKRLSILSHLKEIGFDICTGPTFSITKLTTEGTLVPHSHNAIMHMRHNQVMCEINNVGMCAIPNIYWLDGDIGELNKWAQWLKTNPGIEMISRDFTSTRKWKDIEFKTSELLYILEQVGRSFTILIIGSGNANAGKIVRKISAAGHKVCIVTSAPILKALYGCKYVCLGDKLIGLPCSKSEHSIPSLIKYNLSNFESYLSLMSEIKYKRSA